MRVDDVSFGYDRGPASFSDLRLEIHDHDRICVIGPERQGQVDAAARAGRRARAAHGRRSPTHPRTVTGYFAQTNVHTLHDKRTVVEEIQSADRTCLPQTGARHRGRDDVRGRRRA